MPSMLERQWSRIAMAVAALGLILVTAWLISEAKWLLFGVVVAYIAQALLAQVFKKPPTKDFGDYFTADALDALKTIQLPRNELSRMLIRVGRTATQQGTECAARISTMLHVEQAGKFRRFSVRDIYQLKLKHRILHDMRIHIQSPRTGNFIGAQGTELLPQTRLTDFGDKWAVYYTPLVSREEWDAWRQTGAEIDVTVTIGQSASLSTQRTVELTRGEDPEGSLLYVGRIEMDENWDTISVSVSGIPHVGDALHFYAWMLATDFWEFSATTSPDIASELQWQLTAITASVMPVQFITDHNSSATLRIEARDMTVLPDDAVIARLRPIRRRSS